MRLLRKIFVIFIIIITILIYYKFENKKINYLSISITKEKNYSDYFSQNIKNIDTHIDIIETKSLTEEFLEDIDNNIEIEEKITIQNVIKDASIITIMLDPNEIYNAKTYSELEIIINNIEKILAKIKKINKGEVYYLGFYNLYDSSEIDDKIKYTNYRLENLCKNYKIKYIDLYNLFKNKKYLFYTNAKNLPNKDANIMISNEILNNYNK